MLHEALKPIELRTVKFEELKQAFSYGLFTLDGQSMTNEEKRIERLHSAITTLLIPTFERRLIKEELFPKKATTTKTIKKLYCAKKAHNTKKVDILFHKLSKDETRQLFKKDLISFMSDSGYLKALCLKSIYKYLSKAGQIDLYNRIMTDQNTHCGISDLINEFIVTLLEYDYKVIYESKTTKSVIFSDGENIYHIELYLTERDKYGNYYYIVGKLPNNPFKAINRIIDNSRQNIAKNISIEYYQENGTINTVEYNNIQKLFNISDNGTIIENITKNPELCNFIKKLPQNEYTVLIKRIAGNTLSEIAIQMNSTISKIRTIMSHIQKKYNDTFSNERYIKESKQIDFDKIRKNLIKIHSKLHKSNGYVPTTGKVGIVQNAHFSTPQGVLIGTNFIKYDSPKQIEHITIHR